MAREHNYAANVRWTGNRGEGTAHYKAYGRTHDITAGTKPPVAGSADPVLSRRCRLAGTRRTV